MSRDDRALHLNTTLLALYLRLSDPSAPRDPEAAVTEVLAVRDATRPHDHPTLGPVFDRYATLIGLYLDPATRARLETALIQPAPAAPEAPPAFQGHDTDLAPLTAEGRPGISLVTCSMNRSANLLRALPSWLACPEITEVIIVDWSSTTPVADDLHAAAIADPRIRILRVNGEDRWVLTYAFNAGFRASACNLILKADADIVLSPDFFRRNPILPQSFIAGNWRTASEDQAHVNGFFFLPRAALHTVGGFNEHITTYGWDDDDIYTRLTLSGLRRQNVAPDTIHHLDHNDDDRIGQSTTQNGPRTLRDELTSGTRFLIRRNRYIAAVMPDWGQNSIPLPLRTSSRTESTLTLRREGWVPSRVPPHVVTAANAHALSELTSWHLGRRALDLGPDRIDLILDRPLSDVSRIDIEVALAAPTLALRGQGHHLVLELPGGVLDAPNVPAHLNLALLTLLDAARAHGLNPVLRAPHVTLPLQAPACLRLLPLIPSWEPIGDVPETTIDALRSTTLTKSDLRLPLTPAALTPALTAAAIQNPRPRLYIDAQHGLGNRLRSIASGAAIAEATGRDLVIVWQPDDHCDGHFSDLYDYPGPVETIRFLDTAPDLGCEVYNYMTVEPGAVKDAPINLATNADIYARSASVLNTPASTWESENRFLQSLTPIRPILNLVASVRHPNDLSAHVRMEGGTKAEHLAYEATTNWSAEDHALIDEWRGKSHFRHFLNRIDALISKGRAQRIFLAADMPATYDEFRFHYGDRLAHLPRSLYDRSAEQLHYALADAILLSRSPLLLGSTWSSFSELAMRLAPVPMVIEMSGRDF